MDATHQFIRCCDLEVHLTCWGDPASPAIVMWHGLTRTGRDFDELASRLSKQYYVICPDTIGRGLSQWSSNPEQEYVIPFYVKLAKALLHQLDISRCIWIGTSMGGLIGMVLAAEENTPIRALLINDVGPELPRVAIQRIRDYIGIQPVFNTIQELEAWLKTVYVTFGVNSDEFWRRMAMTSHRRLADGRITLHYDPAIAQGFTLPDSQETLPDLWQEWQAIQCPVFVVQGKESDLLTHQQLDKMSQLKPSMQQASLVNVGHAPTLVTLDQQQMILQWLKEQK